jgi:60 kDa SS-A/Ro ribonucleoprotein
MEPTGLRYYLGIDCSGSMGSPINNSSLSVREAAAAMAMTVARVEKQSYMAGFTAKEGRSLYSTGVDNTGMIDLGISAKDRLDTVCKKTYMSNFGRTDCSLPMLDAIEKKIPVDIFVIYSDNETYAGGVHPIQALDKYKNAMQIDSKLIVIGMTSTGFTIADPTRKDNLDICGFDGSTPSIISNFALGLI